MEDILQGETNRWSDDVEDGRFLIGAAPVNPKNSSQGFEPTNTDSLDALSTHIYFIMLVEFCPQLRELL